MKQPAIITYIITAAILAGCSGPKEADPAPLLYERVTAVSRLNLASMAVTKMATVSDKDDSRRSILDRLKIGNRVAAYSYDTYLQAYIDLAELRPDDISVDAERRTVEITLPPIRTAVAGRDAAMREEHYRVTGLRSPVDARERARLKEAMNSALLDEVAEDSRFTERLREAARRKAAAYIASVVAPLGYKADITFRSTDKTFDTGL